MKTWQPLPGRYADCPACCTWSLLPYNQAAGSKYQYAGMEFKPDYDETRPLNINTMLFEQCGVKVCVE